MREVFVIDNSVAAEQAIAFFTKHAKLPLLTAPQKEKGVLKMTYATAPMNLSEKSKQAMEMLGETIDLVCCI